jgi:hypothetical protein
MFLTPNELRTLTGRAHKSRQVEFLKAHRIRHYVNAEGRPVVAAAWIVGGTSPNIVQPNFAAAKA